MSETLPVPGHRTHRISVVIPIYRAETTLEALVNELLPFTQDSISPDGHRYFVEQVLPVWDNGPDNSDRVIRELANAYGFIRPVWLSRNFGQHPATMAGMASTGGDWIVTMDEDGQHDPAEIGRMLDVALAESASVVYAKPTNQPPHGPFRNAASRLAKRILAVVMDQQVAQNFNSYRLVLGETGRALAAYAGPGVYLDVALAWIARKTAVCPMEMRSEDRPSGYSLHSLVGHFVRMVVTSGTKGLRLVTYTGLLLGLLGVLLTITLVVLSFVSPAPVQGWTSTMCVLLIGMGLILVALGIVAEYIGVNVNMAMGKPLYLIASDPKAGPLGEAARFRGPTVPDRAP